MKKHLFLAAVVGMALTGCVNEESENLTQQQARKISFDTPVMGIQSRAGEIQGTAYPESEKFVVYAKQYTGDFTKWSEGTDFWTGGLTASKVGTTWETVTDYYWPPTNYKLTFAAYSPSTLPDGALASYGNDGLTVTGFDVTDNVDLMYSGRITNQTSAVGAVPVVFKHALSSVVFSAIDEDANASYKITALSVSGLFAKSATFKENLADNGTDPATTAAWESPSTAETMTHTPSLSPGVEVDTELTPITENETAWLMIPQTVDENATVTISYTVTPTNGAPYDVTNKEILLSEFKTNEATPASIEEWAMANRYKYIIKFGGEGRVKIVFAPSVAGWTEVPGGQATYTIQ